VICINLVKCKSILSVAVLRKMVKVEIVEVLKF
jgi:hypothetical protein